MASEKEDAALFNAVSTVLMALGSMVLPEQGTGVDWWEKRCKEEPGCAECKCFDL
jgi:hypothetical protein